MSNYKDSDKRDEKNKNDEEIVTDDIEVSKLGKGTKKNIDNVEKESDERNRMDMIDDKEYDEKYQIGESKEGDLESEETETDEIYQIENPE